MHQESTLVELPMSQKYAADVLILDDDVVFRNLVRSLLETQNYRVFEADNGLKGLQHLAKHVPDLVICDIEMPLLNGMEFVEEASHQYPSLPLIVISGTEKMSVVAKALKFGIKDFVTKPIVNPTHLLSTVESTLKEAKDSALGARDFTSQWFQLNPQGELPEDQELHWHLEYLDNHPDISRDLLQALVPEQKTSQGVWNCHFRVLQSSESMPIVYDYAWSMNGQFLFYVLDSDSAEQYGVSTTLLVRALFNDYIRSQESQVFHIQDLVNNLEKAIRYADCGEPINAIVGLADFSNREFKVISAGVAGAWSTSNANHALATQQSLGGDKVLHQEQFPLATTGKNSLKLSGLANANCQIVIESKAN
ncbi:response regulator [Vibrio breoganii]|nr:two-component system response regulator [Vibrio breoganii]PMG90367.1 two-component system response regulator [Vibrio breoganii]PMJ49615.1 two-component system response regulator [Vibrio breoganii]PMK32744.1 two-component system response regulator [Vibrio breoganii]PMK56433.1 two-component system response regulator [Vibrio breoganii]